MDVDRFIAAHDGAWRRLAALTATARRRPGALEPGEVDELVTRYQQTATHLSVARTRLHDPALVAHLTRLVAEAGGVLYGTRPRTWRAVGRFFTLTFPAAVWRARWFVAVSAALLLAPAVAMGWWLAGSDEALDAAAPAAVREAYVEEDFEAYYSSAPAGQFATEVTVNNIRVSILAFAAGITLGLGTAFVLVLNGANIGVAAGVFAAAGESARFYGLVTPHGALELSAVVVAGAAGLRLGWALVDPGDRSRAAALAEEGRRSVAVVLGLAVVFVVAGTIEAFVTPSALPTWARVGVGLAAATAFWLYVWAQGRRAEALGLTGLLDDGQAGHPGRPATAAPRSPVQRRPVALARR